MEDLFLKVVANPPATICPPVASAAYQVLCTQAPDVEQRITLLLNRMKTGSETNATDAAALLLNVCASATDPISPDVVEPAVETLVQFALSHSEWPDFLKWVLGFLHFYCTDVVTISIFFEYEVPQVALLGLKKYPSNSLIAGAACALLSHFNLYDVGEAIPLLTKCLDDLKANVIVNHVAVRALAEFTSYCQGNPRERFQESCLQFLRADGVKHLESVIRMHHTNEDIQLFGARVLANLTSAVDLHTLGSYFHGSGSGSQVLRLAGEALQRFPNNELMACHVLRSWSNIPRAVGVDTAVVAGILARQPKMEAVWQEAIRCLSSIAVHVKEAKASIFTTGSIPFVLKAMRVFEGNQVVQEDACTLISYLSFDSEAITEAITKQQGIQLVLNAMRRHSSVQPMLIAGCAALSGLTFNNPAGQKIVLENNGVGCIIDAMGAGDRARLQENGCLAIGTMCWNTELKAEVVRLGGVKAIMNALEQHSQSSGLVKNACRALAQIAFNSETYRDTMSEQGVIPLILRGMAQHPHHDRAQMHGCVALSYLTWTSDNATSQDAARAGCSIIIDAMRNHPQNAEVQDHACRALANISNVPEEHAGAALEQVVAAMARHERVPEVQEEACRAMVTLALASARNKDKLYQLNAAERVIKALQLYPRAHLVVQEACNALAHLAYEHLQLNRAVTDLGGVKVLLEAMKNHPSSGKVQLNACGGLSALAFDNTVAQKQIFVEQGVELITQAMVNFDRLRMLELGCSVLGTLAWNTEIKEDVAVKAIPVILTAMRRYEDNPLLQKSTCRAVSQFAFNSENNRRLLTQEGAVPLIVRAMRQHTSTEKLLIHALKALTYLCWENADVAQSIVQEGVEDVLNSILSAPNADERVIHEATHLSKILSKKFTGQSPPQQGGRATRPSPVPASPFPAGGTAGSPIFGTPQPPHREKQELELLGSPQPMPSQGRGVYEAPLDVARSTALEHKERQQAMLRDDAAERGRRSTPPRSADDTLHRRHSPTPMSHNNNNSRQQQQQQRGGGGRDEGGYGNGRRTQQSGSQQQQQNDPQRRGGGRGKESPEPQSKSAGVKVASNNNNNNNNNATSYGRGGSTAAGPAKAGPAAPVNLSAKPAGQVNHAASQQLQSALQQMSGRAAAQQQQQQPKRAPLFAEDLEKQFNQPKNASSSSPSTSAPQHQQQQPQQQGSIKPHQHAQQTPSQHVSRGVQRVFLDPATETRASRNSPPPTAGGHPSYSAAQPPLPQQQQQQHYQPQQHHQASHQNYASQQQQQQQLPVDPRFDRRNLPQTRAAPRSGGRDDLWDDPDPSSYHGNRTIGTMNWQQQQQQLEQQQQQMSSGGGGGGFVVTSGSHHQQHHHHGHHGSGGYGRGGGGAGRGGGGYGRRGY